MAYINEKYQNDELEVSIEILEPKEDEIDFEEGLRIDLQIENNRDFTKNEFKALIKWLAEIEEIIQIDFEPNGKKKIKTCRICGSTDFDFKEIIEKEGYACWFVKDDLCSGCQS